MPGKDNLPVLLHTSEMYSYQPAYIRSNNLILGNDTDHVYNSDSDPSLKTHFFIIKFYPFPQHLQNNFWALIKKIFLQTLVENFF